MKRINEYMELRKKAGLSCSKEARKEHKEMLRTDPKAAQEAEDVLKKISKSN